jgi:hypothetical protein
MQNNKEHYSPSLKSCNQLLWRLEASNDSEFVRGGGGGGEVEYSTPPGKNSDIKGKKIESHSKVAETQF